MINKGSYVRIRKTLLKPKERSSNLPEETKKVPFKMWVKGYTLEESELFDTCQIKTIDGRIETGRIKENNPAYKINYGEFVEEALELRNRIKGDFYE
jgi:hypothetical protein